MNGEKVGDPLDSNFFSVSNNFSVVGVFSYTPLPPTPKVDGQKCRLCGQAFGFLQKHRTCSSCGLSFCERCSSSKGQNPIFCDVCAAMMSDNCRVYDYPGLVEWAKLHIKTELKKMWSIQCAVQYLFDLIKSKRTETHLAAAIVLNRYAVSLVGFQMTPPFLDTLKNHPTDCSCKSTALLLDICVTLLEGKKDQEFPFDAETIANLLEHNDVSIARAAARIGLTLTEQKIFNPNQPFFINALSLEDKLTAAYVLSAIAKSKPIPIHYEIFRPMQSEDEVAFPNMAQVTSAALSVFENDSPIASQATQYYASVILYQISVTPKGAEEILNHQLNNFIECLRKHYPRSGGGEKPDSIISCFIGQVVYDLWLYASQSQKADDYLANLFPLVLQPITEIMEIYAPYDASTICASLQTIFMNISVLVGENQLFGQAVRSEQILAIIDRLKQERSMPLPRSLSNSSLRLSLKSLSFSSISNASSKDTRQEIINFKQNELNSRKADTEALRQEIELLKQQLIDLETSNNIQDDEAKWQKELDDAQAKLDSYEIETEKLEAEIENGDESLEEQKEQLEVAKEKSKNARHSLLVTRKKLDKKKAKLQEADGEIQSLKNEIEAKRREIEQAKELVKSTNCDASETATRLQEKQKEIEKIKGDIEVAKKTLEEAAAATVSARESLKKQKQQAEEAEELLEKYREEIERQNAELKKVQARSEEKRSETEDLKQKIISKKEKLASINESIQADEVIAAQFAQEIAVLENNSKEEEEKHNQKMLEIEQKISSKKVEGTNIIKEQKKQFHNKIAMLLDSYINAAVPLTVIPEEQPIESFLI